MGGRYVIETRREATHESEGMRHRWLRRRPLGRYRYVRLRWRVVFAVVDYVGEVVFGTCRALRSLFVARQTPTDTLGATAGLSSSAGITVGQANRATLPLGLDKPLARCTTASANPHEDPRVILLVQLDHLGDAIISTAMLPPLRRRYPDASIEVLAGPWNREVFEAAPQVDRVHVSRANRFARRRLARLAWIPAVFWWGLRLRRRKVDLGIDVRGDFPVALILWLCGARRRLGWDCGGGGFLLTDRPAFVPSRPEVQSRWALLGALGIQPLSAADSWRASFRPSDTARREIASRLAEFSSGPLVVLHVGAGTAAKSWPVGHWRELLGRLVVHLGVHVVLVGSGSDRTIAARILGQWRWPGVADWTGRLTVVELAALVERAELLVGADSGPAHLAAAEETPVVVLFSGTNNARQWQPCGGQVTVLRHPVDCSPCHRGRCPRPDHPCMNQLRPQRVAREVERILSWRFAEIPC
ncbi:MAG: hypothetical protein A2V70_00525 [Planctomycetes bacterium RBG_13_63_9]|nr:MAG: hypothetical protein A2V70_00525 [Planctomycetes bacterium RBG_13_63_9]